MAAMSEVPRSPLGSEAYRHMKDRKADAQRMIDEAAEYDATLQEALRYAGRQIRAAMLARRVWLAELVKERELREQEEEQKAPETLASRLWGVEEELNERAQPDANGEEEQDETAQLDGTGEGDDEELDEPTPHGHTVGALEWDDEGEDEEQEEPDEQAIEENGFAALASRVRSLQATTQTEPAQPEDNGEEEDEKRDESAHPEFTSDVPHG